MTLIQILILAIIEGVTEFLPISSTAHLLLVADLFQIPSSAQLNSFIIMSQAGAVLAVLGWSIPYLLSSRRLWYLTVVAFVPTGVIGFFTYDWVLQNFFPYSWIIIAGMAGGGAIMIMIELVLMKIHKNKKGTNFPVTTTKDIIDFSKISYATAFFVGLSQVIAFIPGVSRSATTIMTSLLLNISRKTAVAFSFVLAIPTMFAVTGLDLYTAVQTQQDYQWNFLILGTVVSAITAYGAMKWLLKYVETWTFVPFGIYRILMGVIFFSLFFF